jgi:hypothetical protein
MKQGIEITKAPLGGWIVADRAEVEQGRVFRTLKEAWEYAKKRAGWMKVNH